ncbi:hypothetical protein KQI74_09700 [Paenibacillus barcinonensis]|uniref:hypothetical protein n=1 Tax=Paenibacillus TaxID=44249 RepID=UPI001C115C55|nr:MULTISPECIES: hypothetical protein [Paenibacillus]MBU5352554.1 hypothetical protein [Paenibacillus barcinonensis]MDM5276720.1 hypothetical protein [Paenibacillus silvae]
MREESLSREIRYGKQDIAELESASIQVHLIYQKTAELFRRTANSHEDQDNPAQAEDHMIDFTGLVSSPAVLQKWIQAPGGWKCIGCELRIPDGKSAHEKQQLLSDRLYMKAANGKRVQIEMLIQAVVWSQYEKIRMLAPWLGNEPFYTAEELDVIARYIVPTYFSDRPFNEQGKLFKIHQPYGYIPLYQEYVDAPSCCVQVDGELLEGRLLTGVFLSDTQTFGLNPYLKDGDGGRTYMQAFVQ